MKVNSNTEYQYAVVKFLQLPNEDVSDLVCIPYSWIRILRATEGKSIVAYPNERSSVTQRRIQDGERPSQKWKLYMAGVKLETYAYKDANDYVLEKKYGVATDNFCSSARNYGKNSTVKRAQQRESHVDTDMTKLRIVESTKGSSYAKNASGKIFPTYNQLFIYPYLQEIPDYVGKTQGNSTEINCEDIVKKQSYMSKDSLISMKQYLEKSTDYVGKTQDNSTEIDCEDIVKKQSYISKDSLKSMIQYLEKSIRSSNQNQVTVGKVSVVSQVLPAEMIVEQSSTEQRSQDSDIQPIIVDESEASPLNMPQSIVTEDTAEVSLRQDDRSSSEASTYQEDHPVDTSMVVIRTQVNVIDNIFNTMENSYSNSSEMISELHKSFDQSIKLLKIIRRSYNSKKLEEKQEKQAEVNNPDAVMRKDNDDKSSSSDSEGRGDNEDRGNSEDLSDSEDDKKKKTRNNSRNFVLPPEYDSKNTRWTLKYRENNPKLGLVELVPKSNVFVHPIKLAHCKRMSKDCKTLARMLLAEIFSHSALTVCSLTGARANAFHNNGTYIRPGLDENARVTMLTFVEDYARDKQWAAFDKQSVINSIRSRIQEIRSKHAKT